MFRFLTVLFAFLLPALGFAGEASTSVTPVAWEDAGELQVFGIREPHMDAVDVSPDGKYIAASVAGRGGGAGVFIFSRDRTKDWRLNVREVDVKNVAPQIRFLPDSRLAMASGPSVWHLTEQGWVCEVKDPQRIYTAEVVPNPFFHPADSSLGSTPGMSPASFLAINRSGDYIGLLDSNLNVVLGKDATEAMLLTSITTTPNDHWWIITGDKAGVVKAWKWDKGQIISKQRLGLKSGTQGQVLSLTATADGKLVAGCVRKKVVVWEWKGEKEPPLCREFDEHTDYLSCVRFDSTGTLLASTGVDGRVVVRKIVRGEAGKVESIEEIADWVVPTNSPLATRPVSALAFGLDGTIYTAAPFTEGLRVWKPVFPEVGVSTKMPPMNSGSEE